MHDRVVLHVLLDLEEVVLVATPSGAGA